MYRADELTPRTSTGARFSHFQNRVFGWVFFVSSLGLVWGVLVVGGVLEGVSVGFFKC